MTIPGALNHMLLRDEGGSALAFEEDWADLSAWSVATSAQNPIDGSVGVSGGRLVVTSFGANTGWHGPAINAAIPAVGDFVMTTDITFQDYGQASRKGNILVFLMDSSTFVPSAWVRLTLSDPGVTSTNKTPYYYTEAGGVSKPAISSPVVEVPFNVVRAGTTIQFYWDNVLVHTQSCDGAEYNYMHIQLNRDGADTEAVMSIGPITIEV